MDEKSELTSTSCVILDRPGSIKAMGLPSETHGVVMHKSVLEVRDNVYTMR